MQLLTWPYKSLKSLSTMVQSSLTMKRKKKSSVNCSHFLMGTMSLASSSSYLSTDPPTSWAHHFSPPLHFRKSHCHPSRLNSSQRMLCLVPAYTQIPATAVGQMEMPYLQPYLPVISPRAASTLTSSSTKPDWWSTTLCFSKGTCVHPSFLDI